MHLHDVADFGKGAPVIQHRMFSSRRLSLSRAASSLSRAFSTASESMGLPSKMSEQTIATIKATAPVVAPVALDITNTFYKNMLGENPGLFSVFNRANMESGLQPRTLADSVVAYASHIDRLNALVGFTGSPVDVIAHKHCGLDITPDQYLIVHKYLMGAICEVLGDAVTPEVGAGWNEAVLFLAKVCIDAEEELKAAATERSGGWAGFQSAELVEVEMLTADIKRFTFKPHGSNGAPIDFEPGQFLTIRVDPNGDGLTAPRHYTLTNRPGCTTLQCAVKRVEGGVVSSYMHDRLKVGDIVEITPPFGCFVPRKASQKVVLLSGGIGVTPMLSFAQSFGIEKVSLVAHVDAAPAAHAFGADFGPYPTLFKYSSEGGRILPETLVDEIASKVAGGPAEHDFYLCGSPAFMDGLTDALKAKGAKNVFSEAFKGHTAAI